MIRGPRLPVADSTDTCWLHRQWKEFLTEEMIARLLEKVKPDFVQYDCKGHAGYTGYPTQVGWPSPGIVQDSLALWRKVTREHGVGLYIHYSGGWDTAACQHHPEWGRVTPEGQPDCLFSPWDGELLPVHGPLHALLESHCSVDVLAEHHLRGRLADYPVIVLPECGVLPDDFRTELLYYVAPGGQLLALGTAANLFREKLGVTFDGEPTNAGAFVQAGGALAYLGGPWQAVTPATAEPVGWRFPNHDPRKNGAVAATITSYGQGQIAALYGAFGRAFADSHHPVLRHFLRDLLQRLFPEPKVTLEGPPCLDVSLRRRGAQCLIHLANTANMQVASRYAVIDFILPVGPVPLKIRLPHAPQWVTLVPSNQPLATRWDPGLLHIAAPEVSIHEVVVVE